VGGSGWQRSYWCDEVGIGLDGDVRTNWTGIDWTQERRLSKSLTRDWTKKLGS
jgi:hypothetical protein